LVENGAARSEIVLAKNATENEQLAAQELQKYFREISGVAIGINNDVNGDKFPIIIGNSFGNAELEKSIKLQGNDPASFALTVNQDAVRICGLSDEGTLFGSYELLEQIGVRWF